MPELVDLAADLRELARLAAEPEDLDGLLAHALDAMAAVVPYDLAAVLELRGQQLSVRAARGPLANDAVRRHSLRLQDFPTMRRSLESRRPFALLEQDHASEEGDPYDGVLDLPHGHSCMVVPLYAQDRSLGVITFDRGACEPYAPGVVELAGVYGQIVGLAFLVAEQARLLSRERRRLDEQNRLLRAEDGSAAERLDHCRSPQMRRVVEAAQQVAVTGAPVLILGETGVGKEVLAQAIHDWSDRARGPFVKLNCAALPENLVESELFGHVRGAFSGATSNRPGRFSTANGGTLLLDEIGDLPTGAQAKLLRVLQEGTFEPVGSDKTVRVDVRILAATHVDLETAAREGRFREDLYYRLAVFPIEIPPLRERAEDIEGIAEQFLAEHAQRTGRGPWQLDAVARAALRNAHWPGNIRELVNLLERATILTPEGELTLPALPGAAAATPPEPAADAQQRWRTLAEMERDYIQAVLESTGGKIYGPGGAAERLDLKPSTLQSRMKKLGVRR